MMILCDLQIYLSTLTFVEIVDDLDADGDDNADDDKNFVIMENPLNTPITDDDGNPAAAAAAALGLHTSEAARIKQQEEEAAAAEAEAAEAAAAAAEAAAAAGMTVQVSVLTYFLLVCHISKPKNPSALETSTLLQPELTAIYHNIS